MTDFHSIQPDTRSSSLFKSSFKTLSESDNTGKLKSLPLELLSKIAMFLVLNITEKLELLNSYLLLVKVFGKRLGMIY